MIQSCLKNSLKTMKNVKNVKMVLAKISVYLERKFVMDKMDKEHVNL